MGAADVVPGVSGGTMALVLGVYERLLNAIKDFDLAWFALLARGRVITAIKRLDLALIVPLALGIAAAVVFFTRIVPLPKLINTHPEQVYGLFFGLIGASIWILLRGLRPRHPSALLWLGLGTALGLVIVNTVPMQTPEHAWFIFFSGCIAISAMLLPGISGSFILLLLHKYAYVFDAIGRFDLKVLLPFFAGCAVGLLLFSHVVSWLLARFRRPTLLAICGVLLASLWIIWPFQERTFEVVRGKERLIHSQPIIPDGIGSDALSALVLAVIGALLVLFIHHIAERQGAASSH